MTWLPAFVRFGELVLSPCPHCGPEQVPARKVPGYCGAAGTDSRVACASCRPHYCPACRSHYSDRERELGECACGAPIARERLF